MEKGGKTVIKDTVIKISGLTKRFGGLTAVDNFDLDVQKNDIFGLIGPNGAGKTTIFNMITGIIPPSEGGIEFLGEDIIRLKTHLIAQKGIARTFQNIKLFGQLTVLENVLTVSQHQMNYSLFDAFLKTPKCRAQEAKIYQSSIDILERVGIINNKDIKASNLPYGEQRRVEIARALALKPKLLLLDEPAAGMNEEESLALVELIKNIQREFDLTIIVIDHHMDLIMNLCNRITCLNFGQMIAEGCPEEIQCFPAVIEAYLGVDDDDQC